MRFEGKDVRLLILGLLLVLVSVVASAATARGLISHQDGGPASDIKVTIYNDDRGRSSPSRTNNEGMYYLYELTPGHYYLEVWLPDQEEPTRYEVDIEEPSTDLAEVKIP
jgi:Carboxypeptidase regulatory-like domain